MLLLFRKTKLILINRFVGGVVLMADMFSRVEQLHYPLKFQQLLIAAGVGSVTFPAMLGLTQVGLKSVRISTGSPLILATTVGGISVTLSSLVASLAIVKSYSICNIFLQNNTNHHKSEYDTEMINLTVGDMCVSAVSGMIMYRALGGRFMSVLPSHLNKPGAFARQWIPAHSSNYANNTEKRIIKDLGNKYGCHSCGKWRVSQFVADHQPPNKLLKQSNGKNGSGINGLKEPVREGSGNNGSESSGWTQRFYPQCQMCSNMQGQSLGLESAASPVITHPFSLRLYHLFLPIPLGLPLLKSSVNKHQSTNSLAVSDDKKEEGKTSLPKPNEESTNITSNVTKQETVQQNVSELVTNFPLLIVWRSIVTFLDSFPAVGSFHITLWAFSIIAALGTI